MDNRGDGSAHAAPQRFEWIDVARGIGIVAVVAGHVWTGGHVRDALYSFHMPLFFLLSGLLSSPRPVMPFTIGQVGRQMRPYAAFLALLMVVDQIVEPWKGGRPIFHDWPQDIVPVLLGGTWLRGPYTIFWFVPCLMVARILFNAVLSRWPDPRDPRWLWALLPVLGVAYVLGAVTDVSPLGLLTVPMAFLLLWAGAAWHRVAWRRWMLLLLVPLSLAGLLLLFPTLNMKAGDYGWPLLSMLSAVATSLLVLRLARRIAPVAPWLAALGRASLVIMYLHVAMIHYGGPYIGKIWLFAGALLGSFAIYQIMRVLPPLRRIFL
ncbi:MAG: acyltransferase family protein [Sphingobium sp.]